MLRASIFEQPVRRTSVPWGHTSESWSSFFSCAYWFLFSLRNLYLLYVGLYPRRSPTNTEDPRTCSGLSFGPKSRSAWMVHLYRIVSPFLDVFSADAISFVRMVRELRVRSPADGEYTKFIADLDTLREVSADVDPFTRIPPLLQSFTFGTATPSLQGVVSSEWRRSLCLLLGHPARASSYAQPA